MVADSFKLSNSKYVACLKSRIDVGQGINIGPGKFGNKDKSRELNKLENIHSP